MAQLGFELGTLLKRSVAPSKQPNMTSHPAERSDVAKVFNSANHKTYNQPYHPIYLGVWLEIGQIGRIAGPTPSSTAPTSPIPKSFYPRPPTNPNLWNHFKPNRLSSSSQDPLRQLQQQQHQPKKPPGKVKIQTLYSSTYGLLLVEN